MTGAHPADPTAYAAVLLMDLPDRVLLVQHAGEGTWSLPGTWVAADESPLEAGRRAVADQLRIDVPAGRLLVVEWNTDPDEVHFLFDGGIPEPVAYGEVAPDPALVSAWCFADGAEAPQLLGKADLARYSAALYVQSEEQRGRERTAYLENGGAPLLGNAAGGGAEN